MQKWEYNVIDIPRYMNEGQIDRDLNNAGELGWELVCVLKSPYDSECLRHYFKRLKE